MSVGDALATLAGGQGVGLATAAARWAGPDGAELLAAGPGVVPRRRADLLTRRAPRR